MLFECLILLLVALLLIYRWSVSTHDHWAKRGIAFAKPLPLIGNMKDMVFRKKSMFEIFVDLYKQGEGNKVYGVFDQRNPLLLIRDPELLKQITIKDFDHFVNHRKIFDTMDEDDLFMNSLFSMQNDKWKDMRSTLSPAFTGSKMRQMFQLMVQVSQNTISFLQEKEPNLRNTEGHELDLKDYCTRFSNDIIASTAFGIQVNSFENIDNEFYRMGKKATNFTTWQNIKFLIFTNFKFIVKTFKMKLFDQSIYDYFMHLVLDAMAYRKEHNIVRPDMINMLMEARGLANSENARPHNRDWSDIDIVAQCFLFFFAGFETTAVLMCFTAHELMENPEVQEKLLQEIVDVTEQLDGKPLTYEALQGMRYMDMVISEVLRKWPAAVVIDRACNKDIVYELDNERVEIKKGDTVMLPLCGIHRDPKYYTKPEHFDPERFSDENKDSISPFTYFPFGLGPRNCIGSRFALLEAKAIIFYLVREFHIGAAKKTVVPIKLSAKGFNLGPDDGFWLKLTARTKP